MEIEIRPLRDEDVDKVAEIEAASFSMPWTRDAYKELVGEEGHVALVILADGKVVGAADFMDVLGEACINNIVIAQDFRGKGLGRKLCEAMIAESDKLGCIAMTLEVRVSNTPAINLYKSLGFESAGVRPGFYDKPKEDAYIMWKKKD